MNLLLGFFNDFFNASWVDAAIFKQHFHCLAGNFAAQLFEAQSWIALLCGLVLLIHFRAKADDGMTPPVLTALFLVLAAMLLALLQQYAVAPRIVARENLKLWHSVGSGMYLVQWLCTSVLLWRMSGGQRPR